jgi:hypothetical protein
MDTKKLAEILELMQEAEARTIEDWFSDEDLDFSREAATQLDREQIDELTKLALEQRDRWEVIVKGLKSL